MPPAGHDLGPVEPFQELQPVPRKRVVLRAILGPVLWLVSVVVVAAVVRRTDTIGTGLVVAAVATMAATILLVFLRERRERERRRAAQPR